MAISNLKIKNQLKEKGYIVIKNFFTKKQVKELLKSYEKNIDYCNSLMSSSKKNSLDKKYLYLEKKNKNLKSKSYDLSKYHPSLFQLATDKKLMTILESVFKETFFLDFPQIRIDDNKNSFMLPMHQEIFGQMSRKLLTLWCPLTDVSKKNGTLTIQSDSHKMGVLGHEFIYLNNRQHHAVKKKYINKKKIKYFNLKSGDIVLFDPYLIHGTGKNFSNKIRWTFIARYNAISGIESLKSKKNKSLRILQK
jgi:ectoine hydroxylase-related dioxygenase (phytanoyl-CoA dioxygenase family)